MFYLSNILIDLQAVIAARAARDRALTVLLVALWGRVARMRARLERLVALWRAGALPVARARQGAARVARVRAARGQQAGRIFRPLLRMLTPDAVPEVVRLRARPVVWAVVVGDGLREAVAVGPAIQISPG